MDFTPMSPRLVASQVQWDTTEQSRSSTIPKSTATTQQHNCSQSYQSHKKDSSEEYGPCVLPMNFVTYDSTTRSGLTCHRDNDVGTLHEKQMSPI